MNSEKLLDAMDGIPDELLTQTNAVREQKKKKPAAKLWLPLAACLLLITGFIYGQISWNDPENLAGTSMDAVATPAVSYLQPVYLTADKPSAGIASMESASAENYVVISKSSSRPVSLSGKWYVIDGDVTFPAIRCTGDVHLILKDGSRLTLEGKKNKAGIQVESGASLTVYAQSAGEKMGSIIAVGGSGAAGIGGGKKTSMGSVTINGGNIIATGVDGGAGIGGGEDGIGENITVNGGAITAIGSGAAGIGGGIHCSGQNIVLNGGIITAIGGENAAGIGGGTAGNGENITVTAGTVTATGNLNGAGIGAGSYDRLSKTGGSAKNITILGGTVTATGGECGMGIGHSANGSSTNTHIAQALTVLAGSTENPETAVCADRTDLTDLSADSSFLQQYVIIKP